MIDTESYAPVTGLLISAFVYLATALSFESTDLIIVGICFAGGSLGAVVSVVFEMFSSVLRSLPLRTKVSKWAGSCAIAIICAPALTIPFTEMVGWDTNVHHYLLVSGVFGSLGWIAIWLAYTVLPSRLRARAEAKLGHERTGKVDIDTDRHCSSHDGKVAGGSGTKGTKPESQSASKGNAIIKK